MSLSRLSLLCALLIGNQWRPAAAESVPSPPGCACDDDIDSLDAELTMLEVEAVALADQTPGLVGFNASGAPLGTLVGLQQYAYKTFHLFYNKSLGTTFAVEDEGFVPLCGVFFDGPDCTGNPAGNGTPQLGADLLGNAYIYEPLGVIDTLPDVKSWLDEDSACSPFLTPAAGYPMKKVPLPFDIPVPLPVTIKGGE